MEAMLENYFEEYNIDYKEYKHPAVFTVEESKTLKADIPGMHCKTLFLKDSNGKFYLIGMKADKRLDTKKLKKYFGVRKLHFASAEELFEKLKLRPGSVSIFGMVNCLEKDLKEIKLIIDKEVWQSEKSGFHPNINTSTIVLEHKGLKKFYDSLECEKEVLEL